MNAQTKFWLEKVSQAIGKRTFRVWMHGHYLSIYVLLQAPKGKWFLRGFKWYREKLLDQHIQNLLIETLDHWYKSKGCFKYKHGEVE